jgi:hypothetical protein
MGVPDSTGNKLIPKQPLPEPPEFRGHHVLLLTRLPRLTYHRTLPLCKEFCKGKQTFFNVAKSKKKKKEKEKRRCDSAKSSLL